MNAVRLSGVTKTYGAHRAVDSLDLEIPMGSVYGFIGPNGSGKTTTIRMILHIIHPDQGEIEVLGKRETRASNDRIGYLPEERGMYKKMSVKRLLTYYGMLKGMAKRDARRAGAEWMERLGLGEWLDKKVEALSKGMAQKVQFISTVISAPELVILDEPFSGVGPGEFGSLARGDSGTSQCGLDRDLLHARHVDGGTDVRFDLHDLSREEGARRDRRGRPRVLSRPIRFASSSAVGALFSKSSRGSNKSATWEPSKRFGSVATHRNSCRD